MRKYVCSSCIIIIIYYDRGGRSKFNTVYDNKCIQFLSKYRIRK